MTSETSAARERAEKLKSRLLENFSNLEECDIEIRAAMESYHPGTNRNAGPGKLATFLFVDLPTVPSVDDDIEGTPPEVTKAKEFRAAVTSYLQSLDSRRGIEYVGRATSSKGYETTTPNRERFNVIVKDDS